MKWRSTAEKLPYPCVETEFGRSWAGLIVVQGKVFPGGWDSETGWWIAHPGCRVLEPNSVSHWRNYPAPPCQGSDYCDLPWCDGCSTYEEAKRIYEKAQHRTPAEW